MIGTPLLIVIVATYCQYTLQYPELNNLKTQYSPNFEILAFPCNQFGLFCFLPKTSTIDAILYLLHNLTTNLNKQSPEDTVLITFVMEKAIDKVPYQIINSRLSVLGLSQTALPWFTNYLSNRFQQTYDTGRRDQTNLKIGQLLLLKQMMNKNLKKFSPKYHGPFKVIQQSGRLNYKVKHVNDGHEEQMSGALHLVPWENMLALELNAAQPRRLLAAVDSMREILHVRYGCVAVLNRNPEEIEAKISFDDMKKREQDFFIKHSDAFHHV
ncbi:unnamed protein product [Didymodactylos carnosus]|uniref:Uncharacterized protein n=1 Tax=Didymodactylos carnosus TaxID=1234261 RepID=A0A814U9F9_9BILA|nr:unnamed protein product [Didymodactylos carnosus]CAF3932725.1 unnamed protein product [Didymodactylos carnosus]